MKIIFTNHARERIVERSFDENAVLETLKNPKSVTNGKQKDTLEYVKYFEKSKVTVIVKENNNKETLILSCWIDPPIQGTKDAKRKARYEKYKKAGILKKIYMDLMSIFGI